jgi:hypothetical protein
VHAKDAGHPQRHDQVQSTLETTTQRLTSNAVAWWLFWNVLFCFDQGPSR